MKIYLLAFKVLRQLGWRQGFLYIYYQFLLRSGILSFLTPLKQKSIIAPISPFPLKPDQNKLQNIFKGNEHQLIEEADKIVEGQITIFGTLNQKLDLKHPGKIKHWTKHKDVWINGQDIKLYWEVGRFGWATSLARAYTLSNDEKYAQSFWLYTEEFLENNPNNCGIHWVSAQEVALRLISLSFCYSIFADSKHSSKTRQALISQAISAHANRIPPSLVYARAQNNNHLITEALGLYTAAAFLPKHPSSKRWRALGWKWLNHAFQTQIKSDGSYIQNSNNYHRLMLQSGLWAKRIADILSDPLPNETLSALSNATLHINASLDEKRGQVPNLGPNDGAYIFPLSLLPFEDYRPLIQTASRAFLHVSAFPKGLWDEMALWLLSEDRTDKIDSPGIESNHLSGQNSWASLRAVKHQSRPGHADQLHVELWWQGLNIAQDAGTYLYNAPSPWQNALSGTDVHNTISINGQDQMLKASRFLYLDWAQATIIEKTDSLILAEQDGYRKLGLLHRRSLELIDRDTWKIQGFISSITQKKFTARLHWLLPDWPWIIKDTMLELTSPHGLVTLKIDSNSPFTISLARAGELLYGEGDVPPHRGWASPTYAIKNPALSFAVHFHSETPLNLVSLWSFPE